VQTIGPCGERVYSSTFRLLPAIDMAVTVLLFLYQTKRLLGSIYMLKMLFKNKFFFNLQHNGRQFIVLIQQDHIKDAVKVSCLFF